MTKPTTHLARSSLAACALALSSLGASAQFNDDQMKAMLATASGLGMSQAAGDACGTDMSAMANLIARGWKCQGASADQLSKLQTAVADARKGNKVGACPMDKAAHAQQMAKTTAELEAGLAKVNCKG